MTLLLLYQHGYEIGKYISLEKLIENSKNDYYRVLGESSEGWRIQNHNLLPWWNYFLSILKSAHQELTERVEISTEGDNKSTILRQTILSFPTAFSVADIQNLHPNLGRELIKKVLFKLRDENQISLIGKGRAAKWKVNSCTLTYSLSYSVQSGLRRNDQLILD